MSGTAAIAWPSFAGTAQPVGATPDGRVTVYVDPTLGTAGQQNAAALLADAPRIVAANDALFGTTGGSVNVVVFALGGVTDGTGGADHLGCDYVNGAAIEVDAAYGSTARVGALFEAELSECTMGGTICGQSTGEALSRWCAATTSNNALADFATAPTWAAQGMPDWISRTEATDQNPVSIGCGMAFISWLLSQGQALPAIAQGLVALGNAGTFDALAAALAVTAQGAAFAAFTAAIQALPGGITTDDPFGALLQATGSMAAAPAPAPASLDAFVAAQPDPACQRSHRLRIL